MKLSIIALISTTVYALRLSADPAAATTPAASKADTAAATAQAAAVPDAHGGF